MVPILNKKLKLVYQSSLEAPKTVTKKRVVRKQVNIGVDNIKKKKLQFAPPEALSQHGLIHPVAAEGSTSV